VADRFIPSPKTVDSLVSTLETVHLSSKSLATSPPGHTDRLAAAAGVNTGRRLLECHELLPVAKHSLLTGARGAAALLHGRTPTLGLRTGEPTSRTRTLPSAPQRVLDAPGILDDFCLNVLA
jgi:cell division cycle protein 20 (cofactor of APC complex)